MSAEFNLPEILEVTGGVAKSQVSNHFKGVQTDSRQPQKGSLFVPLKGENFDGHDFVVQAVKNGASGVLIHKWKSEYESLLGDATLIQVPDTLQSLQDLAQHWRTHCDFQVVGVTGSNGKTSTKEILTQILKEKFRVYSSPGSFNNHWGVPLSLLAADRNCQVVVQEMGMNHSGEIKRLCEIARPNIVLVTMVGRAHIGELGSVDAIREAKNEIYKFSPDALRIYNLDNDQTLRLYTEALANEKLNKDKILTFSSHNPNAHVQLRAERVTAQGLEVSGTIGSQKGSVRVNIFGRHNVVNLMAASSAALALGMKGEEIFKALGQIDFSSWGRNQWIRQGRNWPSILFDGYNANPESMGALLKNLYELDTEGKKAFIFGDMRELGSESENAHSQVAELAAQVGLSFAWYMGEHQLAVKKAFEKLNFQGQLFVSEDFNPEISKSVLGLLGADDVVALKASRGSRIERVLNSWGVDGF